MPDSRRLPVNGQDLRDDLFISQRPNKCPGKLPPQGYNKYKLVTETGHEFEFEMVVWGLWLFFLLPRDTTATDPLEETAPDRLQHIRPRLPIRI